MNKGKILILLYLIAVLMGLVACESKTSTTDGGTQDSTANGATAETAASAPETRVLDFLKWYKQNEQAFDKIQKVKQVEGEPYEILTAGTEEYLTKLKSSGFISDVYLDAERAEFKRLAADYAANPQTDGPPTGFDYDRVLLAQDWNDLDQTKVSHAKESGDKAEVTADIGMPLRFSLTKVGGNWMIDHIDNPGEGE